MKFDQFSEGQSYVTKSAVLSREEILDFATKYDPQYFHIDEEAAKQSHFGEIIAAGAHILSILWREWVHLDILGKDCIAGVGLDEVEFKKPVYPGDVIYAEVYVHKMTPLNDGKRGILHLKFIGKNQQETPIISCIFKLMVHR